MKKSNTLKRHFSGIFLQLFFGLWSVFILLALLFAFISSSYQHTLRTESIVDNGAIGARSIDTAVALYEWGGPIILKNWLRDKKLNRRPEVFVVDDAGHDLLDRPTPVSVQKKLSKEKYKQSLRVLTIDGRPYRLIAVRTENSKRSFAFAIWNTPVWVLAVILLICTTLVAMLLAWHFASPIRKLDWAMRRAMSGNFDVRVSTDLGHRFDEIGDLAKRYDAMLEKIEGLLVRQKRLFHDVSHELRSPLARISVALALLERDPENAKAAVARIEMEIATLDTLVEQLLTYARLDENAPILFEKTDLSAILNAIAENANFEGSAYGVCVKLDIEKTLPISAHVESLTSAIENLVRNALRFSPKNSEILISAKDFADSMTVTIEDNGPGIDETDMEKLFLPFVRGHNQATGSGFGLGMAIAKRAIERHNGTIALSNKTPHGLRVTIRLKKINS